MSGKAVDRIYWISTILFVLLMAFSASQELQHAPELLEALDTGDTERAQRAYNLIATPAASVRGGGGRTPAEERVGGEED